MAPQQTAAANLVQVDVGAAALELLAQEGAHGVGQLVRELSAQRRLAGCDEVHVDGAGTRVRGCRLRGHFHQPVSE